MFSRLHTPEEPIMQNDIFLHAEQRQFNAPALLCYVGAAAILFGYAAYMMAAVHISDRDSIAVSAIVGLTLIVVWAIAGLHKLVDRTWLWALGIAGALLQTCNAILLAIAPQAVIFVNFAALHVFSVLAALGLVVYCWIVPRSYRLAAIFALLLFTAGACMFPFMPLPTVVGIALGVIPAAALASWFCSLAIALNRPVKSQA